MNSTEIFQLALNLSSPWFIIKVETKSLSSGLELHIHIEHERGYQFTEGKLHDRVDRSWRHLNFFEHHCYLHCKVPRLKSSDGSVKMAQVPWARKQSGFTLLFEAYAMALIEKEMPVSSVGDLVKEYPQRIWNIFNYWIEIAYSQDDQGNVKRIGVDETSVRKGHDYITVMADIDERRVIHATPGKDQESIAGLKDHLLAKGVEVNQITDACIDMSTGFIAGFSQHFPDTAITFDRFHVVKLLNEAMDQVRKNELREHSMLKKHKYILLASMKKLGTEGRQKLEAIVSLLPTIGEAYRLKVLFNDLWEMRSKEEAEGFLAFWCDHALDSGIYPFKKLVGTIIAHWSGIVNYVETQIANGIMEGINSKIQLAKRRARGYRNIRNFINMVYFIMGKLKFNYPHYSI